MESNLLGKISSVENLQNAWNHLHKLNRLSHGLSGETIEQFEQNKDEKIRSISSKLQDKSYSFKNTRGVLIPKANGNGFRPLQIPEISDRVVIKAIAIELEEIFKETIKKSNGYSFAYQKNIGIKDAVLKIREHYEQGYKYVLEADLKNFFGTVDKNHLLDNKILPALPDNTVDELIRNALSQEIGNIDSFKTNEQQYFSGVSQGIPQGNALSPLLSNIYLSAFDVALIDSGYKLVRYADDFVIMCKTNNDCQEAYLKSEQLLTSLNLEIHPLDINGKTKITHIDTSSLTFLSITFDGKNLFPSRDNFNRLISKIWELNKGKIEYDLLSYLNKLKNKHDGWVSAFIYTDISRYSKELDANINRALYLKLKKIDWTLSKSSTSSLPRKFSSKNSSKTCLSETQRNHSGIPSTEKLIASKQQSREQS